MTAGTSSPVRLWLLAAVAATAACGGGGGGGGQPGGDSGGNPALGTLSVESSSLTFTAMTTSHSPPYQTVRATVTGVRSGTLYIKVAASGPAIGSIANVYVTSTTGGQADVFPGNAYSLGPGVYTGTVQVWACTSGPDCTTGNLAGSPQTIDVTFRVYGVATSVASASYAIGNTLPADSARDFTVRGTPGEAWSASSDASWLSLSLTSGTGDTTTPVTASLVPELVDAMPNGAYTAAISVVPAHGLTVRIPVTLSIARTQLDHVAPAIATSGAPADVILRGQNLDQVAVEGLSFGDTPATAFQIVSSSEIRATHPALAAGSYPVRLQTNLGTAFSLAATLVVVDAPSYGAAVLPYPTAGAWYFMDLAYDPQRRALLVGAQEGYGRKLLRYGYTDGVGWGAATETPFADLEALAWSADAQRLLVGSRSGITEVDPATLAVLGTTSVNGEYASALAVTNDGEVLVWAHNPASAGESRFYRCSLRSHTWTYYYPDPSLAWVSLGASGDGSRVVLGGERSYLPQLHRYDASTRTFSSLGQRSYGRTVIAVDRTGSRTLMGSNGTTLSNGTYQIFDADLALLGSLPGTSRAAVIHPDGTRAYTYEPSGTEGTLRVFDLTQAPVAGAFPELGTAVTLAGNPEAEAYEVKMVISPDGGTIFLAGDDAIVVEPAPRR